MSLTRLVYKTGVKLADRLGIYERRSLEYASIVVFLVRRFTRLDSSFALDVGAGRGKISELIGNALKIPIVAVDIDPTLLKGLRTAVITPIVTDAHHLPFRDNTISLVCLISILEHLAEPDLAIKEVSRVLKDDGMVVVQLPNLQWFIEPHTKWPLLYFMPSTFREIIRSSLNYLYINFSVTIKNIIKAFGKHNLTLGYKMKLGFGWSPAWFLVFHKR